VVSSIGGGALLGGLVGVTGDPDSASGIVLDVLGAWNSVKNASVLSNEAGRVTLSGFVHADVALGSGGGGDSSVVLHGAKRGNVLTGSGGDEVTIETATNVWAWVNEFRVATGAGEDTVVVRALDTAAAASTDPTFAATTNGAGAFTGTDAASIVFAELGAGDDVFIALGASADRVAGGSGSDVIRAGAGADLLSGGAGDDLFVLAAGDGEDTILDFRPGADRLGFGLGRKEARALLEAAVEADGATTISYGADSVVLVGVAKAQLTTADLL
jgi:Ca2+-binding RTX toxin-like protein